MGGITVTEEKLIKLFNSMTLEEKLGELWQPMNRVYDENGVLTYIDVKANYSKEDIYRSGSTLNLFGTDRLRAVQDDHVKNNPHHIPLLYMADIIHGYATVFPNPIAQSCSFDLELIKESARVTAKESTLAGINVTFFPMIDIVRDPRWGRVVESAGEDPYLAYSVCRALVEGLQGDGLDKPYTMAACVKHFAGYGAAEGGRDYNTVELTENTLRNVYLWGYKGGIDADAAMIMTSYNEMGGIPSTCNKHLFRDILRDEWGYKGVVITDLFALSSMATHGIGDDSEEDDTDYLYRSLAEKAMTAGIDIEMGSHHYKKLALSVAEGKLDEKLIDEACLRWLKLKNKLGLFENPYRFTDDEKAKDVMLCDEHKDVARRLAAESCVLLKNEENILPLGRQSGKIAMIGPFVESERLNGSWVIHVADSVRTLRTVTEQRCSDLEICFAKGCSALGREQARESKRFGYTDEEHREEMIREAVEIARSVDTVVLTLGEISEQAGEAKSRSNICIPDVQLELFDRVYEVNKKIVVLLYNGRPLDISYINDRAKAILDVWYLGTMMNDAVVDLLLGEKMPSGKLSMSFPKTVAQIPVYYNHLRTDHRVEPYWSEYIDDCNSEPLYPFGYGLTYTELSYGETAVDKTHFKTDETVTVSCDIANLGDRDCTETAELYITDRFASVARPVKELKGFKRVYIPAGKTVTVTFEINIEMLKYYNENNEYVADPGSFYVKIARDSGFDEGKEMTRIFLTKD